MKHPETPAPPVDPEFLRALEKVRQAYRLLEDLEESVDDLTLGLSGLHGDGPAGFILLMAYVRRQASGISNATEEQP